MNETKVEIDDTPTQIHEFAVAPDYPVIAYVANYVLHVRRDNAWLRTSLISRTTRGFGRNEPLLYLTGIALKLQDWLREDDQVLGELMQLRRGAA